MIWIGVGWWRFILWYCVYSYLFSFSFLKCFLEFGFCLFDDDLFVMLINIVNVNYKFIFKVIFFICFKCKSDYENKKIKDKIFISDINIWDYINGIFLCLKICFCFCFCLMMIYWLFLIVLLINLFLLLKMYNLRDYIIMFNCVLLWIKIIFELIKWFVLYNI